MPLVRFDSKALASGSFLVGAFTLVELRTGMWAEPVARQWSQDRTILQILVTGALYAALFYAGHLLARRRGKGGRTVYCAIGAAAALPANLIGLGAEGFAEAWATGTIFVFLLLPVALGAMTGFVYHRRAGYETEGDDPAALAAAAGSAGETASGGLVRTDTAAYYDGPLQVRTSGVATLIAALTGATLHILLNFVSLVADPLPAEAMLPLVHNNPGLGVVYGIAGIALPYFVFVRSAHSFLQRRGKSRRRSYVLAGLFTPLAFGLAFTVLMGPFGVIMAAQFILPSMVAMAAYHALAGMEPLALPEDIEVSDPRTLVGEDHVRRRMRRVIGSAGS